MWQRDTLTLSARKRGFHLISDEVEQALAEMPRHCLLTVPCNFYS